MVQQVPLLCFVPERNSLGIPFEMWLHFFGFVYCNRGVVNLLELTSGFLMEILPKELLGFNMVGFTFDFSGVVCFSEWYSCSLQVALLHERSVRVARLII